jgi:hypothetical protein
MGPHASLFNELCFTLVTRCVKNMATYPIQDIMRNKLIENGVSDNYDQLYSGIGTGCTISIICNPINTIKVPLQETITKRTSFSIAKEIYKEYGMKGFYYGGTGVFLRDIAWASIYFPLYQQIKIKTDNPLISSLGAGVAIMIVSYPFDGMRLYRQHKKDYHLLHGFKKSFQSIKTNFKLFGTGIITVPLSITMSLMLYIVVMDYLDNNYENN